MKNLILIIVLMVITISTINAQNTDFIDVKKGKDLNEIRIHEINDIHIVYEQHGSLHDVLKSNVNYLEKDSVSYIVNNDGELVPANIKVTKYLFATETEILNNYQPEITKEEQKDTLNKELFELGYQDAIKCYKGGGANAAAGYLSGLVPFFGLFPPIIIGAVPPSNKVYIRNADKTHLNNSHYKEGYKLSAMKIKQRNVWGGFLSGFATILLIIGMQEK